MKIPRNASRVTSRNEIFVVILITFVKLMNSLLSRIIKFFSSSMLRIHEARRIRNTSARITLRNRMVQSLGLIVSLHATKCCQIRTMPSEMKHIQLRVYTYVMEGWRRKITVGAVIFWPSIGSNRIMNRESWTYGGRLYFYCDPRSIYSLFCWGQYHWGEA